MGINKAYNTNWACESHDGVTDAARKALEKAHRIERDRIARGWRWVKVNAITSVLVPCDKKGKPTKEGLRKIALLKPSL